jgi:putative ABC transport system permease protein
MTITWIRFAVANLFRNRRRSFYTILAVAIGFAAVNMFGGFTSYIFTNLKDSFIYVQANGHLTIFKKGFLTEGRLDPLKFLITKQEMEALGEICAQDPRVVLTTPQLQIMGMISNGAVSTVFVGTGRVPSDTNAIESKAVGMLGKNKFYHGKSLEDDIMYGIGLTKGLAEKLKLDLGSDAITMAPTVDGRINALDAQVFQTFTVPVEELNDKIIETPLNFAQSLYDTDSIDRLTVLLENDNQVEPVKAFLQEALDKKGLNMEVKTWEELSPFYMKVKDMFDIIFVFIFVIVFIIVVTSVINTLSMSVIERTREIGTLRALGLKRRGIIRLFALESAMLGILGSIVGLFLTIIVWTTIKVLEPQWTPPNIVSEITLEVYIVPIYIFVSFVFLVSLSAIVAVLPARKAAHKSIVDALGHV